MSETQATHTPGPWHTSEQLDRIHGGEIIRAGDAQTGTPVAVCCDFNRYDRDAEREANARLIAAAPELLAIAKVALTTIKRIPPSLLLTFGPADLGATMVTDLSAAIAKATGSEP